MKTSLLGLFRLGIVAVGLMAGVAPAMAEPVRIPVGMSVDLELQQHVNSAYTPTGSPIYFRVARDVVIGGQTLIGKGTLVTGRMQQAQNRGMVGRSGSMSLTVRSVKAVDGTDVPIEADLSKQGRSRTGATVAWTLFWGIPGLVTHGVNPYLEKGAEITATVLAEVAVDPANAIAPPPAPTAGLTAQVTGHKQAGGRRNADLKFDIERKTNLKTVAFDVSLPAEISDADKTLANIELLEVDGVAVPEQVKAMSASKGSAEFDGWSIVRFCHDGVNTLTFGGVDGTGRRYQGTYQLRVVVKKKG